jgi:hypothetical protein
MDDDGQIMAVASYDENSPMESEAGIPSRKKLSSCESELNNQRMEAICEC